MKHDNEFYLWPAICDCAGENIDEQAEAFSEKFNTMVHECDNCVAVNTAGIASFMVSDIDCAGVVPSEDGEPPEFNIVLGEKAIIKFNPFETACFICTYDDGEGRCLGIILRKVEDTK